MPFHRPRPPLEPVKHLSKLKGIFARISRWSIKTISSWSRARFWMPGDPHLKGWNEWWEHISCHRWINDARNWDRFLNSYVIEASHRGADAWRTTSEAGDVKWTSILQWLAIECSKSKNALVTCFSTGQKTSNSFDSNAIISSSSVIPCWQLKPGVVLVGDIHRFWDEKIRFWLIQSKTLGDQSHTQKFNR
jgi:hypothetical protein